MASLGISITKQDCGNFNVRMIHHKANGQCDFTLSFTMELPNKSPNWNKTSHFDQHWDCDACYVTSTGYAIWAILYLLNLSFM